MRVPNVKFLNLFFANFQKTRNFHFPFLMSSQFSLYNKSSWTLLFHRVISLLCAAFSTLSLFLHFAGISILYASRVPNKWDLGWIATTIFTNKIHTIYHSICRFFYFLCPSSSLSIVGFFFLHFHADVHSCFCTCVSFYNVLFRALFSFLSILKPFSSFYVWSLFAPFVYFVCRYSPSLSNSMHLYVCVHKFSTQ